jgi:hypothetical protein
MSKLTPPFVVRERGDLIVFDRLEDIESQVEAYDVGSCEFFDANGQRLVSSVDGYRVQLHPDPKSTPEPDRLEAMLRSYLGGLGVRRPRFADYASAANRATSLHELLQLRLKLSNEPRYGFWSRIRQRFDGSRR